MPTWIFKKRAGAPAGTITIDLQSTPTSPDFTITDAVDSQITTTDASIAYELLREPYLRLDGIETDPYVPQPVVKRVFTSNGELVEVGNDGSATPLLVAKVAQSSTAVTYNADGSVATTTTDGVATTYTYNADGTVATAVTPVGSQTRTETFAYDSAGTFTGSTVVTA